MKQFSSKSEAAIAKLLSMHQTASKIRQRAERDRRMGFRDR